MSSTILKSRIPGHPTITLTGPQGVGKTLFAMALGRALRCSHVIDGEHVNGEPHHEHADVPLDGALIVCDEAGGDLSIVIHTRAGFHALLKALEIPLEYRPPYSTQSAPGPGLHVHLSGPEGALRKLWRETVFVGTTNERNQDSRG